MNFSLIKRHGIIFDLDGTLLESSLGVENALKFVRIFLIEECNITEEKANQIIDRHQELAHTKQIKITPNFTEGAWRKELWKQTINEHNLQNKIDVENLWKTFTNSFLKPLTFSEEIKCTLRTLRADYKLAILTNGCSEWQRAKLERCEAAKYFDQIVVSGEERTRKPDPKIFHLTCRKLGLESRQCVMVGDRLSTDIIGAYRAGFKATVWIKNNRFPNDRCEEKPNFEINHVTQLTDILSLINFE